PIKIMPLLPETNPNPQTEPKSQIPTNPPNQGLFTLPDSMSGTMAEVQTALQQLQLTQSQIITNQNQIYQHLEQLKTNATQQLTNLTDQFKSLRLTHTQEKKQIEFNPNPKLESDY
ncbi:8179_t:CDS:2, partial [Funneliformis geosporum]